MIVIIMQVVDRYEIDVENDVVEVVVMVDLHYYYDFYLLIVLIVPVMKILNVDFGFDVVVVVEVDDGAAGTLM